MRKLDMPQHVATVPHQPAQCRAREVVVPQAENSQALQGRRKPAACVGVGDGEAGEVGGDVEQAVEGVEAWGVNAVEAGAVVVDFEGGQVGEGEFWGGDGAEVGGWVEERSGGVGAVVGCCEAQGGEVRAGANEG